MNSTHNKSDENIYQIKIQGLLDQKWSDWFPGMEFRIEKGNTVITGPVADQAALHGILSQIRDLNLALLSVDQKRAGK